MDPNHADTSKKLKGNSPPPCSICLEHVVHLGDRSIAKLQCGHEFHLDCIGSAFNAKGVMQCPNCRKVEKGHWLYGHEHRPSTDFDFDGWITTDNMYDLSYSELPLAYQWCPFSGITQLSIIDDTEGRPNSNAESLGDGSSSSGGGGGGGGSLFRGNARAQGFSRPSTSSRNDAGYHYQQPGSTAPSSLSRPIRSPAGQTGSNSADRAYQQVASRRLRVTSPDAGGVYGFPVTVSPEYGWRTEVGFAPFPWIPYEGESQWWGPFNPNHGMPPSGNFLPRGASADQRPAQIRPGNAYPRRFPPSPPPPPPPPSSNMR